MAKTPGLGGDVPGRNEMRPHQRDAAKDRGVLKYVQPFQMVHDLGAPRDALTSWRGAPSPASAEWPKGQPTSSAKAEQKALPIQTGVVAARRDRKTVEEK